MDNPGEGDERRGDDSKKKPSQPKKRPASLISEASEGRKPQKQQHEQRKHTRPRLSRDNDIVEGHSRLHSQQIVPNPGQSPMPPRIPAHLRAPNESQIATSLLPTLNTMGAPVGVTRRAAMPGTAAVAAAPSAYQTTREATNLMTGNVQQRGPPSVSDSDTTTRTNNLTAGQSRPPVGVVANEAAGRFGLPVQSNLSSTIPVTQQQQVQSQMEQIIAQLVANQGSIQSVPSNDPFAPQPIISNPRGAAVLPQMPGSLNPFLGTVPTNAAAGINAPAVNPSLAHLLQIASGEAGIQPIEIPPNPEHLLALLASRARNTVATTAASGMPGIPPFAPAAASLQPSLPLPPPMSISEMQQVAALATLTGVPPTAIVPTSVLRQPPPLLPGRPPGERTANLYMPTTDELTLSRRQVLLRQQIEFFEASPEDIQWFCAGRRREISVGQVGIRCKHCAAAAIPPYARPKGTVYFPSTLRALYQAAQNMGQDHFLADQCIHVNPEVKQTLKVYSETPTQAGYAGKKYWADGAKLRGIYETERGLRFHDYVQ